MALQIYSYEHSLIVRTVKSTHDTFTVGTRNAIPVSLPFNSGSTIPTAFAAPVEDGIIFIEAARPARQSFPPLEDESTTCWVAVAEWIVVINPSAIPHLVWITLAMGAKQLVVHEALDMMC